LLSGDGVWKEDRLLSRQEKAANAYKTYENIIKPDVAAAGLAWDEIQHSTMIDKPMYEQLLVAENEFAFPLCASTSCVTSISARTLALDCGDIRSSAFLPKIAPPRNCR
jgi:hypothetical protein